MNITKKAAFEYVMDSYVERGILINEGTRDLLRLYIAEELETDVVSQRLGVTRSNILNKIYKFQRRAGLEGGAKEVRRHILSEMDLAISQGKLNKLPDDYDFVKDYMNSEENILHREQLKDHVRKNKE